MAKLYFRKDEKEVCYDLETQRDHMLENDLKELDLFEAKRETGTGFFYCREYGEVGEVNMGCGKQCEHYKPNNGKNGRCKHYGYCYEMTDKKITIYA